MSTTTDGVTDPAEGTQTDPSTEAPPAIPEGFESIDLSTVVLIKVDGEEQEITLGEAIKGYQRQADYTRKTQEASQKVREAESALQLERALRANPQATLQVLSEHYGVRLASEDTGFEIEDVDPRMVQMQGRLDELTSLLNQQSFDREVAQLQATFGEIDVDAVRAHQRNGGFPTLRSAAADLLIEDALPVYRQHAAKAQQNELIVGLKRQVAVAAPGAGATVPTTSTVVDGTNRLSVQEAAQLAREGKTVKRWSPDDWKKPKKR